MNTKNILFYVQILALVGVFLSVYLLWQQMFRPSFQPCTINATVNCDAIISGEVSKTLGISTPLYGLIGYTVILLAAFFRKAKLLLGVATFGLVFCLWIGYRELIELKVVCPVCILCQLVMTGVFGLGIVLYRRKDEQLTT